VKPGDRITLPSGTVGIISEFPPALAGPVTRVPYVRTVWLV
jgi:hypothetical protein